ncbi:MULTISPECIES: DUF2442 domain-containing protein [Gordonibacter]|uniref:DUF2442 domain-containing protein n=1 Tax=Gordonibacter faecis TaxID=3047475 RepID=A0ABT7DPW5_9ACTN|nr:MULTISPECIES: DUF2442 domain-containing protein [unclassified Gordonibacter]MDJ1651578.1 DUF2442 domain-containing protein [Gordonibacter sp. KGMB12511]HIW77000.1 DUF2442 domain-containing protein [Candidatus Gordonibacter avicola]
MWEPVVVDGAVVGMNKSQPDLTRVEPKGGTTLLLEFETGEQRLFDAAPLIAYGDAYRPLEDERYFKHARIIDGGMALAWPAGQEVCPEALFELSVPVK